MISPGQEIPIEDKMRESLGQEISAYIDDLEQTYSTYIKDIATWWRWYEAEPMVKGQKSFPFLGASNIVVPLIRIMADAHVNRMYAALFRSATDIWTIRTEREDKIRETKDLGRFLNWAAAGNDFNFRLPAYDNMLESAVIGSSVMALNWREDVRWAYAPPRGKSKKLRAVQVNYGRGAHPEHVPREQMLWDTNFQIQDAPFVCREFHWSWSQLRAMADLDSSWHRETIEAIKGKGEISGPSTAVAREKDKIDGREPTFFGITDMHNAREVHMDWPLLGAMGLEQDKVVVPGKEGMDHPSPPIVATIDRRSKKVLRLIAEPYYFPGKPFYDIYYRKNVGRGQSSGIAKMVSGMQRGMTATFNQDIDSRTRANAVWAKTSRKELLHRPLNPASAVYDPDMKSFAAFDLHTTGFDGQRIQTMINTIAERLTGQSDPAMGRDTRQGGHPSPARSTIALLQQSDLMQGTSKELLRLQYSRIGSDSLSLYQQFETNEDGKLERMMGGVDAERISKFMFPEEPVGAVLDFDVLALSNANNPADEMQKNLVISQMNQTYWLGIVKAVSFLENPQVGPIVKKAVIEGIRAQTKTHLRFLESGDVDDLEHYVLTLADTAQSGSQDLELASQRAQEIAQSRGGPAQPGLGVGGGAAPGGAPGALGAGGRI